VVDLPADAARILRENLWQLYDEQPIATPPAPAAGDVELVAGAINDAVTKWTKTPTDQRERFDVILAALRRI
jgi:HAMP domain-containing protein